MANQPYFPTGIGDRIVWLTNFRNKFEQYATALAYSAAEIATVQADCDYCIYLFDTFQGAARRFSEACTTAVRETVDGAGATAVTLPSFIPPPAPPAVLPGAFKRIFAFVKNLKTRPGYVTLIGMDLGVIGAESTQRSGETPGPTGEARSGEVVISFKKKRHLGVWIEGQVGIKTAWSFLAIDPTNPTTTRARSESPISPNNGVIASAIGTASRATTGVTSWR